jgi:peptidoglycan/LPS O-acetylase OafA/YrhL
LLFFQRSRGGLDFLFPDRSESRADARPSAHAPAEKLGSAHLSHPKYRADIDGVRAVAILSVVAYHAFPKWIRGGFVGVDIFFVISGFLISTIIFENLEKETFSFTQFYARRVKRIFPALIVVLIAAYVFGWFALLSEEYMGLGKHLAAGAGFVSNIVLWQESGYFDPSSETKPLLHLWSLGVEEQFYIVWPMALWIAWQWKQNFLTIILVVALLSLSLNLVVIHLDPVAAFYSPITRFWELLFGSVLARWVLYKTDLNAAIALWLDRSVGPFLPAGIRQSLNVRAASLISIAGVFLLAVSITLIDSHVRFPGAWALLPVGGATLLILAGPTAWFNRAILSNRVAVWFGAISFPLYLWHWPLLSFARIVDGEFPDRSLRLFLVVLAIALAWLTYQLIERPIRFGPSGRFMIFGLSACMFALGWIGYATFTDAGLPFRFNAKLYDFKGDIGHYQFIQYLKDRSYPCLPKVIEQGALETFGGFVRCRQSKPDPEVDLALIGDSHAESLFPGLSDAIPNRNIAYYIRDALPLLYNPEFATIFNKLTTDNNIKDVIISAEWYGRISQLPHGLTLHGELEKVVHTLESSGKRVYLLEDVPLFPFDAVRCQGRRWLSTKPSTCEMSLVDAEIQFNSYEDALRSIAVDHPPTKLIFIRDDFCDKTVCRMTKGDSLLYRDSNHLNINGSLLLGRRLVADDPKLLGN